MKSVVIIGVTGYVGSELRGLLARHPHAELVGLFSGSEARANGSQSLAPVPDTRSSPDLKPFNLYDVSALKPEYVFLATPPEFSAAVAPLLSARKIRVIDLSGAFRLSSATDYSRWYGFDHPAPELLPTAVYGLTEFCNGSLSDATLVANPGCYPTCALLSLKPVAHLLHPGFPIICDAKSGVSGAGKKADLAYSFAELSGNFKAYSVGSHRHEPEIRRHLGPRVTAPFLFATHLLPIVRGMLTTTYVTFALPVTKETLTEVYQEAYAGCPFVLIKNPGELPQIKDVVGTPFASLGLTTLNGGSSAVIVSVIDNLMKGAASQAVQNFNRMAGLAETEGLC